MRCLTDNAIFVNQIEREHFESHKLINERFNSILHRNATISEPFQFIMEKLGTKMQQLFLKVYCSTISWNQTNFMFSEKIYSKESWLGAYEVVGPKKVFLNFVFQIVFSHFLLNTLVKYKKRKGMVKFQWAYTHTLNI